MKNVRHRSGLRDDETAARRAAVESDAHMGTRNRVARLILGDGPATATQLAERLCLTPAAVRRHLDGLLAAGLVEAREQRVYGGRGRGRPAKVFALTDEGRGVFYQAYDALAIDALEYVEATMGEHAVDAFARRRLAGFEESRGERITGEVSSEERLRLLAEALTEEGYAACTTEVGTDAVAGAQLCQHHCPVAHVATRFPQLCEAETEVFSRLLGTHVQRLATIAHGDGVCTTFIPVTDVSSPPRGGERAKDETASAHRAPGGNRA